MAITVVAGIVATQNDVGASFVGGTISNSTITNSPISGSTGSFTIVSASTVNTAIVSAGSISVTGNSIFSGAITAPRFVVNSNTLPSNGIYLPAANTVGIATGSVQIATFTTASINLGAQPITVSAAQLNIATSGGLEFATITSGQGAQTATLLNSPVAGNPSFYIPVRINGAIRFVPAW